MESAIMRMATCGILLAGVGCAQGVSHTAQTSTPRETKPDWVLTFAEEGDGPAGTAPDPTKWVHDLGGGGWGQRRVSDLHPGFRQRVLRRGGPAGDRGTARDPHRRRRHRTRLHLGPDQNPGVVLATLRTHGSADQDPHGSGRVAGLLDAGRHLPHRGVAVVRGDRHHGERGQPSRHRARHAARPGLLGRRGAAGLDLAARRPALHR